MLDRIEQKICDIIEAKKDEIIAFGTDIFEHAELGYKEVRTSGKFIEKMNELGLETETGLAFTGVKAYMHPKGTVEGPTLAVIGEMDALPIPNHPNAWNGAAHSCGHHAQLTGIMGAALALTDEEVKKEMGGNICFFAVPAEEFVDITWKNQMMKEGKLGYGGGKCELIRIGAFDDIDISLGHHSTTGADFGIINSTSNGFVNKTVTFKGRAAHAAGMPHHGIDALNAATAALVNIALQQESFRDEDSVRCHGFISNGGSAVNVIADEVVMQYCTRGKTPEAYKNASDKVDRSFKAAAMATGCDVTIETMAGYMSQMANPHTEVIQSVLDDIKAEGVYTNQQDQEGHGTGSDDFGDVSCLMPLVHFQTGGLTGTIHGPDLMVTDPYLAYVVTAKIFALTAYRLMKDNAAAAKENIADYEPVMTKESYIEFQDSMQKTETFTTEKLPIVGLDK
ncbi:MAG: amidohydrolase [Oscillospiraceae bacterium]|nr:amidohydrolase [Oscillospiraceae bacterium]